MLWAIALPLLGLGVLILAKVLEFQANLKEEQRKNSKK